MKPVSCKESFLICERIFRVKSVDPDRIIEKKTEPFCHIIYDILLIRFLSVKELSDQWIQTIYLFKIKETVWR